MNKKNLILLIILSLVLGLVLLVTTSCVNETDYEIELSKDGEVYQSHLFGVYTIKYNGKPHEFIIGRQSGIAHWPDCKYCSENKNRHE